VKLTGGSEGQGETPWARKSCFGAGSHPAAKANSLVIGGE